MGIFHLLTVITRSVKPRLRLSNQCLDNFKMYKVCKICRSVLCGSRVMSILTKIPGLAEMMLGEASSLYCIHVPVAGQCLYY